MENNNRLSQLKAKAKAALTADIRKKYGADAAKNFNEVMEIPRFSTGFFTLDDAIGGGLPQGRIVEIYGWESVGKSYLTSKVMANAQKDGGLVYLFDAESGFNPVFANKCGLNTTEDYFTYSGEQNANKIFKIIESILKVNIDLVHQGETPLYPIIVIDSVASLLTDYDEEHDAGAAKVGDLARVMSTNVRRLVTLTEKAKTTVVFINQLRQNINIGYGANPEITSGGKALGYYASVRIELKRVGGQDGKVFEGKDNQIGHKVKARIVKNKTAPPHKQAIFTIFYDGSTDDTEDVYTLGLKYGIISKQGNTHYYKASNGTEIKTIGKDKTISALRDAGQALRDEIIQKIRSAAIESGDDTMSTTEIAEIQEDEKDLVLDLDDDEDGSKTNNFVLGDLDSF